MSRAWDRIFAQLYDPFLWLGERLSMDRHRRELLARADGRVLEIGAGTGLNLRYYGDTVDALVLAEPIEPMARVLDRRVARLARPAEVHRAPAETLPFANDSFDTVVSTLVLCTVEDPGLAMSEIARVLRPGGQLLYVEHVRSDSPRWARWQDRLERPWEAFAGGCRCNRRTLDVMAQSPLRVEEPARAPYRGMVPLIRPLAIGRAELPR